MVVLAVVGALVLAPVVPWMLAVPGLYTVALISAGLALFIQGPSPCTLFAAPAIGVMHMSWGIGFLATLLTRRARSQPRAAASVAERKQFQVPGT